MSRKLTVEDISSTITQDASKIYSGGVYIFRYGKIIEVIINFYPQSGVQAGDIIATGLPLSTATYSSRFGIGSNGSGFDVDYLGNLRISGTVVVNWTQGSIVYLER